MEFAAFHRQIYQATRGVCERYDLWLAGGYAIRAHSLVERPSQHLDFATVHSAPLPDIADAVADTLAATGLDTRPLEVTPRSARIMATDHYGIRDMERLARRQSDEFSIAGLATRLEAAELMPDRAFEAYGLGAEEIARVRRFAFDWLEDIKPG